MRRVVTESAELGVAEGADVTPAPVSVGGLGEVEALDPAGAVLVLFESSSIMRTSKSDSGHSSSELAVKSVPGTTQATDPSGSVSHPVSP